MNGDLFDLSPGQLTTVFDALHGPPTLARRYQRSIPGAGPDVEAVRLTAANLWRVFEWADSKPFYGPREVEGEPLPITGLTAFTPDGRVKAEFGDWVVREQSGRFIVRNRGEFEFLYTLAEVTA
jgi:hypothetical protein